MTAVIRSELLRSVSGFSVLAIFLVAVLLPVYVLCSDGSHFDLAGLEPAAATLQVLQPLAWTALSAAFVGAYTVTREYYYGSMDRTLVAVGFRRAFAGKLVAGALVAVGTSLVICVLWTAAAAILLIREGQSFVLGDDAWGMYGGALVGAVLGALLGGAIGWITRNYYVTAAILLAYPLTVEFALLRTAPEVARYSPGLVLAAIGAPAYQGRLLDLLPALGVALVWTGGLVGIAWARGRRAVA